MIDILKKIDEKITHKDIDRTHRLSDQKPDKNNPRVKIFRSKRKIERKRNSVTESLTKTRMEQLQKAREEYSFRNVWSNDWKMLYIDGNTVIG